MGLVPYQRAALHTHLNTRNKTVSDAVSQKCFFSCIVVRAFVHSVTATTATNTTTTTTTTTAAAAAAAISPPSATNTTTTIN